MAKVFDGFPGQAPGHGNADVIGDGFQPSSAPVEVSDVPDTLPVDPTTEPAVDPASGLPLIPVDLALGHTSLEEEDLPDHVPDDILVFLF